MNLNPYFTAYIKINSKYITYLNIRSEIIKTPRRKYGGWNSLYSHWIQRDDDNTFKAGVKTRN